MQIIDKNRLAEVIFENINNGIIMLDRDFKILAANNALEKWIEKPVSELIGKDCREIFHAHCCFCPHCASESAFATGMPNIATQKITLKNSQRRATDWWTSRTISN